MIREEKAALIKTIDKLVENHTERVILSSSSGETTKAAALSGTVIGLRLVRDLIKEWHYGEQD